MINHFHPGSAVADYILEWLGGPLQPIYLERQQLTSNRGASFPTLLYTWPARAAKWSIQATHPEISSPNIQPRRCER